MDFKSGQSPKGFITLVYMKKDKDYWIDVMGNMINRFSVGEGKYYVSKLELGHAELTWDERWEAIQHWEKAGHLRIIKDPREAEMDEICVELLTMIGKDEPLPQSWRQDAGRLDEESRSK